MKKVVRLTESDLLKVIKRVIKEDYSPENESEYNKLLQQRESIKSEIENLQRRYDNLSERIKKINLFYNPKLIISYAASKTKFGDRYLARVLVPKEYWSDTKSSKLDKSGNKTFHFVLTSPKRASEYTGKDDPELIKDFQNEFRKKTVNQKWLNNINFNPNDVLFDKNMD